MANERQALHGDVAFGHAVKPLFAVAPTNYSINFGSYGCPPRSILDKRLAHMLRIDANSDVFFRVTGEEMLQQVRASVAAFIGCTDPDDILLVTNAAYAYNVVAESIVHNPAVHAAIRRTGEHAATTMCESGEHSSAPPPPPLSPLKMLMFERQYPMCKAATAYWNHRGGAGGGGGGGTQGVVAVDEMPLTSALLSGPRDALVESLATRVVAGGYHFFLIDHVCWSPAFVFPIAALCQRIRALEAEQDTSSRQSCGAPRRHPVVIVVDAAHAIGNVDLRPLFEAQEAALLAAATNGSTTAPVPLFDAYFSNCHKWLMAPKSAAVLYIAPQWQHYVHPCIRGNYYRHAALPALPAAPPAGSPLDRTAKVAMQREFFCPGTTDHSSLLVLPDVIAFRRDVLGGEERIRSYCHQLARAAASRIAAMWGSSELITDSGSLCAMTNVYCPPGCTTDQARQTIDAMLRRDGLFGAVSEMEVGRPFLRISAQVYNALSDYEGFAERFLEVWRELTPPS